jgi:hypothetical protein
MTLETVHKQGAKVAAKGRCRDDAARAPANKKGLSQACRSS